MVSRNKKTKFKRFCIFFKLRNSTMQKHVRASNTGQQIKYLLPSLMSLSRETQLLKVVKVSSGHMCGDMYVLDNDKDKLHKIL